MRARWQPQKEAVCLWTTLVRRAGVVQQLTTQQTSYTTDNLCQGKLPSLKS